MTGRPRSAGARLVVQRLGLPVLVEDLGRTGQQGIGVGRSGAADRGSLRLANRALGNPEGAAALEVTLGGLVLEVADEAVWVCVTGAPAPLAVDDREHGPGAVVAVRAGQRLRLGTPATGLRSYLAVRGGLDVPEVLGSRSHDVMGALGPDPLAVGDELTVGPPPERPITVEQVPQSGYGDPAVLRVVRGPRDDRLVDAEQLVATVWHATEGTNRVAIRLEPDGDTVLEHVEGTGSLPSEGAWAGAVQVPTAGAPVVLGPDHPVTGGYPVVGVVRAADLDRAAQVRPGDEVRFRWSTP